VTSQYSFQSRRIRKLGPGSTIRVDPLITHTIVEHCVKISAHSA